MYGFAGGDPINYSDALGLCPWCVTCGIGAVVGAASAIVTSAVTNAAQNRPLLEGAGGAALAGGVAGGITGATLGLASPASAAIVSYQLGIGLVSVGAVLRAVKAAAEKLSGLADKFGTSAGQIANSVLRNGKPGLDRATGNISAAGLAKGVADGRFVPR